MTKVVFGSLPHYYSGGYAFVAATAEVVDGRLIEVEDARSRFPNNGEFYIHQRFIPDGYGRLSAGLWEVRFIEKDAEDEERSDRFAHFVAISNLAAPHEIVQIDCNSECPDALREILLKGVPLPYRLTSDPLIELSDGVIAGPLRILPQLEGDGFRCHESGMDNPIRAWRDRAVFSPFVVPEHTRIRSFVPAKSIPKAEFYIDLCPLQEAIRSVVRLISKEGPGKHIISKREQELLAEKLAAGGFPEHVEARRDRIFRLLKLSVEIPEQLETLMEMLLAHPKVKARLESEEKRSFESGQQRLTFQEAGLHQRIADLVVEERRMKQDLETLSTRIKNEEERGIQQADGLEQVILARAIKARDEVGALLAEVAILQPFLSTNVTPLPKPTASPGDALDVRASAPTQTPKTFPESVCVLQRNLTTLGLIPISARAFSRDVMAAICAGQLLMFRGSLCSLVARTVARSLACGRVTSFQVPVGFAGIGGMESDLRQAVGRDACAAFIVEGANRSCIDAYGAFLTQVITERVFGLDDPLPNLILLGTVLEGPSALPPGPELTSLGPIFHTDCLAWESSTRETKLVDGQLAALPTSPRSLSAAEGMNLSKWRKALGGTPNALWAKNVDAVYKGLGQRPEKGDYPSAIQSLSFGWLLPRAEAMGVDLSAHADLLSEVREDEHVRSWLVDFLHIPESSKP